MTRDFSPLIKRVLAGVTLQTLTKSGHYWTTYPPLLVNVVWDRPLSYLGLEDEAYMECIKMTKGRMNSL